MREILRYSIQYSIRCDITLTILDTILKLCSFRYFDTIFLKISKVSVSWNTINNVSLLIEALKKKIFFTLLRVWRFLESENHNYSSFIRLLIYWMIINFYPKHTPLKLTTLYNVASNPQTTDNPYPHTWGSNPITHNRIAPQSQLDRRYSRRLYILTFRDYCNLQENI